MQFAALIFTLAASAAPDSSPFVADQSDVSFELGSFARGGFNVIAPDFQARFVVTEALALEIDVPIAILEGQGTGGTSVFGNVSVAGTFRTILADAWLLEIGGGVALPTGFADSGSDRNAQSLAAGINGFVPSYRYGAEQLGIFVPLRLESRPVQNAYFAADTAATLLFGFDSPDVLVGGTLGGVLRAGYRPGPVDVSVGLGASMLFGESVTYGAPGDAETVEGQLFAEPALGLRLGPEENQQGLRVQTRLRVNLDAPAGGTGFDGGGGAPFGGGLYALFFELGYRFSFLQ